MTENTSKYKLDTGSDSITFDKVTEETVDWCMKLHPLDLCRAIYNAGTCSKVLHELSKHSRLVARMEDIMNLMNAYHQKKPLVRGWCDIQRRRCKHGK